MKIRSSIIWLLLISLMISSCKKEDDQKEDQNDLYTISGHLISNGLSMENTKVDIDGLEQFKTSSNADGFFQIKNVSPGNHSINTRNQFDDGSFIQKSYDVVVNNDLNVEELLLPNPVSIVSLELDSANNSVIIKWNKSNAEDFSEYKLYSHLSSGLDEITGKLEFVGINVNDTSVNIKLLNLDTRYFRIFVLNEHGQLGGSNIENITSLNPNLLKGADFENQDFFDSNWTLFSGSSIDIIDTMSYEGNQCLYMQNDLSQDPFFEVENYISYSFQIEYAKEYKLSFWYRLKGVTKMDESAIFFRYIQDDAYHIDTYLALDQDYNNWPGEWISNSFFKELEDTGWLYYSKTFFSASDSPAVFYIGGKTEHLMFDNIELRIQE